MAESVNRTRRASVAATLCGLLWALMSPAWALGPDAPFAPPKPMLVAPKAAAAAASAVALDAQGQPIVGFAPEIVLAGIRRGQTQQALINERWLSVGERIGPAQLVAIAITTATLAHPDGRRELLSLTHSPSGGAAGSTSKVAATAAPQALAATSAAPKAGPAPGASAPTAAPAATPTAPPSATPASAASPTATPLRTALAAAPTEPPRKAVTP